MWVDQNRVIAREGRRISTTLQLNQRANTCEDAFDMMFGRRTGEGAIRRCEDEIDLVIMDVVMPRMGGREVMNEMQTLRPDIKILFTSGYSESGIHTNFILEEGLEFIAKP